MDESSKRLLTKVDEIRQFNSKKKGILMEIEELQKKINLHFKATQSKIDAQVSKKNT
ncbi:hypothetical protein [Arcticibacterium luteifluviistationis]|uniref:hypothetical protein n=1 Tax=Arcticibacterium luteifluviistationis TaxID=1784714 RepID=UPI0013A6981E|nr:hypothetical protein [Arcticibacterium luteifluviistationis]